MAAIIAATNKVHDGYGHGSDRIPLTPSRLPWFTTRHVVDELRDAYSFASSKLNVPFTMTLDRLDQLVAAPSSPSSSPSTSSSMSSRPSSSLTVTLPSVSVIHMTLQSCRSCHNIPVPVLQIIASYCSSYINHIINTLIECHPPAAQLPSINGNAHLSNVLQHQMI
jgi:hypothetical protein